MNFTTEQKLRNVREAIRMVEGLRFFNFTLTAWQENPTFIHHIASVLTTGRKCQRVACLGGHLPYDDYFQKLGVRALRDEPYMLGTGMVYYYSGFNLGTLLFGDANPLFAESSLSEVKEHGLDRTIILARLNKRVVELEGMLAQEQQVKKAVTRLTRAIEHEASTSVKAGEKAHA
jgi:hypothetical protein